MKGYVFFAKGFEEIEAITVVDVLRRAGLDITMVSVTGAREVVGAHGIPVMTDELFEYVDHQGADMLILPGGMPGTNNLAANHKLGDLLKKYHSEEKWVAAICAAPLVLGGLGILKGLKATCYPGFEPQLEGAEIIHAPVVQDGHIITSRGAGTALEFALKLVEVAVGIEKARNLKEGLIVAHN